MWRLTGPHIHTFSKCGYSRRPYPIPKCTDTKTETHQHPHTRSHTHTQAHLHAHAHARTHTCPRDTHVQHRCLITEVNEQLLPATRQGAWCGPCVLVQLTIYSSSSCKTTISSRSLKSVLTFPWPCIMWISKLRLRCAVGEVIIIGRINRGILLFLL